MRRFLLRVAVAKTLLLIAVVHAAAAPASESNNERGATSPFELRDGDRVVLIGSTFIERMQRYGYLETMLTVAHPEQHIVFRNLGWSGDNVFGDARALFGSRADGFRRLVEDVTHARPTLIVVAYGANEAYGGAASLDAFRQGLEKLLDALKPTGARFVLLSPIAHEPAPPPLPRASRYNQQLGPYCNALREVAQQRGIPYVDIVTLLAKAKTPNWDVSQRSAALTDNGIHLSQYGYWRIAPLLAERVDGPTPRWQVTIDAKGRAGDADGAKVEAVAASSRGLRFQVTAHELPEPPVPDNAARYVPDSPPDGQLQVTGLPAGRYRLDVDGQHRVTASHKQWAEGVAVSCDADRRQAEQLRQVICEKNELYFHRYRPENETYLFLFRKHEQGNNAVEIPQFDPLVARQEQTIAKLRKPVQHTYELIRLDE